LEEAVLLDQKWQHVLLKGAPDRFRGRQAPGCHWSHQCCQRYFFFLFSLSQSFSMFIVPSNLPLFTASSIDIDSSLPLLEIKTSSRTYRLEASSKEEAVYWVASLRAIREHYRTLNFESWQKSSSIEVISSNEEKLVSCVSSCSLCFVID